MIRSLFGDLRSNVCFPSSEQRAAGKLWRVRGVHYDGARALKSNKEAIRVFIRNNGWINSWRIMWCFHYYHFFGRDYRSFGHFPCIYGVRLCAPVIGRRKKIFPFLENLSSNRF